MSQNANVNAYLRTKVLTAPPEELRLLLLDGAIKFAVQGREGLVARNYESSFSGISQCRDIVVELMTTIAPTVDAELAAKVRGVFSFLFTELTEASLEKNPARLDKVIEILQFERETWVLAMQKIAHERAAGMVGATLPTTNATSAAPEKTPLNQPRVSVSLSA
ncbi:MAG: flagellar protein FliS [Phycisphaerales bacterium]|nr:flagellar protein FliS [Phycisphaerales bacterium]